MTGEEVKQKSFRYRASKASSEQFEKIMNVSPKTQAGISIVTLFIMFLAFASITQFWKPNAVSENDRNPEAALAIFIMFFFYAVLMFGWTGRAISALTSKFL